MSTKAGLRVLVYGLNFAPEVVGIGKYTGEWAEWLAARGHDVVTVAAPPYYPQWSLLDSYPQGYNSHDPVRNLHVIRCPIWLPARPFGLGRIVRMASYVLSSFPVALWQALRFRLEVVREQSVFVRIFSKMLVMCYTVETCSVNERRARHLHFGLTPLIAVALCVTVFGIAPGVVQAADDTFACLSEGGPTETLTKDFGYSNYKHRSFSSDTKFDAYEARWKQEQYPDYKNAYPINIGGGSNGCWTGGIVVGTSDPDARWGQLYQKTSTGRRNAASIAFTDAPNMIVDGFRTHNTWDAVRMGKGSTNFRVQNSWITRNRDDCIENDNGLKGTVDDSLFDGCYVFYSATGGDGVATLQNNIARLEPMPGAHNEGASLQPGTKGWLKGYGLRVKLYNNVFRADQKSNMTGRLAGIPTLDRDGNPQMELVDCKNNVMIWLGEGDYPYHLEEGCFTVLTGDEGQEFWDAVKQNWINCHPKVPRLPGDPESDPSKCDPNAYGGGQGGTALPGNSTDTDGDTDGDTDADSELAACHLLDASRQVPPGFGAAYSPLSQSPELLLKVWCTDAQAEIEVGNGDSLQFIYERGYELRNGRWRVFTYKGANKKGRWLVGRANATLSRSAGEMARDNFFVAYVCHWQGRQIGWKCGCRDSTCIEPHWQLQKFRSSSANERSAR